MRFLGLTCIGLAAVAVAGCGPGGPPSLEGFGDEVGDGDGDTIDTIGDGDGDGDTVGDGDGDDDCLIEGDIGSPPQFYFEDWVFPELGDDLPNLCGQAPIADYAVSWTAPHSGSFRTLLHSDVGTTLTVLRGDCDGSNQGCEYNGGPSQVDFEAIEGQRYTFVVDGDAEGWFGLELLPLDVMPGSCPVGELFGTEEIVFGNTFDGGFDFGSVCGGGDSADVEYLFFPPVTGIYRIDTHGSSFDTVLTVLEGQCFDGVHLECNDDDNDFGSLQSRVELLLFADNVYTLVVDGFSGDAGAYQLNLELVESQTTVCDDLEQLPSELPLFLGWSVDQTDGNAYHECSFVDFEQRFAWTPPQSGTYRIVQFAANMFSSVAVLDDCEGGGGLCMSGGDLVELVFDAVAGQELIIISEWEPIEGGEISLMIDSLDTNQGCGEDLPGIVPAVVSGTTVGSGDDHEGSCSVNPTAEQELWWTAPESGSYRFTLEGSSFDTLMYIREGGCDGPELGCNDDTNTPLGLELWSTIDLDLVAGQTVSIFIEGFSAEGDFELTISQL